MKKSEIICTGMFVAAIVIGTVGQIVTGRSIKKDIKKISKETVNHEEEEAD